MTTKTTGINNGDIRLDANKENNFEVQTEKTEVPKSKTSENTVKNIALTGFGVLAGVVGAIGLSAFREAPAIDDPSPTSTPEVPEPETLDNIQLSHMTDDSMSFNEAFAAAREEVGPHGIFEWRGGVYGTYYADEWANFSDEYKTQFSNHNWRSDFEEINEPVKPEDNVVPHFGEHEIRIDENGLEYISLTDAITGNEVKIMPGNLQYAVLDEYGDLLGVVPEASLAEDSVTEGCYVFDEEGNYIGHMSYEDFSAMVYAAWGYNNESGSVVEVVEIADVEDNDVVILNAQDGVLDLEEAASIDENMDGQYNITIMDDNKTDYLADNNLPDYANDISVDDF